MDTLHERLWEVAGDAPTGGAPAAELWAHGKRGQRLRAAAVAATVLVVGAIGAGVLVAHGSDDRSRPEPAAPLGFTLPIRYPAGEDFLDLGDSPGPLAAVWLAPRADAAPQAVGLVAHTGTFGALPIDLSQADYESPDAYLALSPDGHRIAYQTSKEKLVIRDLVSGQSYSPAFEFGVRAGYTWTDGSHLVGHVAGGSDVTGWVWTPGTTPRRVDLRSYPGSPYLGPIAGTDPWFLVLPAEGDLGQCPSMQDMGGGRREPTLCDVVGVVGSEIALTHVGLGAVVALDVHGVENPALRRVIATSGAPQPVTFATDLIQASLDFGDGAS